MTWNNQRAQFHLQTFSDGIIGQGEFLRKWKGDQMESLKLCVPESLAIVLPKLLVPV
jgi:hypothetical protein